MPYTFLNCIPNQETVLYPQLVAMEEMVSLEFFKRREACSKRLLSSHALGCMFTEFFMATRNSFLLTLATLHMSSTLSRRSMLASRICFTLSFDESCMAFKKAQNSSLFSLNRCKNISSVLSFIMAF